ncbi:MAG: maleylacetoacetate isomerase [Thalassotalea sp.]|nr:maleylacetoacetate isomerase [Thalassotalea sp.]MDG2393346.1 maleylacetoacetate isomerase [Thalassotalea sp.]
MITLYGYWRSSAAYRVRIALNLKQLEFQQEFVHLVKGGGEQHSKEYAELNPAHLVPTLIDGDFTLNQSLAIIDYLDEQYPNTSLYPADLKQKATSKALVLDIACEIHPINNLRVQQYLSTELQANDQQKLAWMNHWMGIGFSALESRLAQTSGKYCVKDDITVADLCLVPQVYNAKRFNIDMSAFTNINRIVDNCNQLQAFIDALPENQLDAV